MLIRYHHDLIDITVHDKLRLYQLWSDVFPVRCLEQVLDAVSQIKFSVFHIAGITCMEPPFFINCLPGCFFFVVITRCYRLATQKNLVVRPYDPADRTYVIGHAWHIARHCRCRLGQTVTYDHADACGMYELLDHRRHCRTRRREEITPFESQHLLQVSNDGAFVEPVFHSERKGRHGTARLIAHITFADING